MRLAILMLIATALSGCGNKTTPGASASATASASVSADSARQVCTKLCARASRCGLEAAKRLAGSDPAAKAAYEKAKAAAPQQDKQCAQECDAEPPEKEQTAKVADCLRRPDCETFEACLLKL